MPARLSVYYVQQASICWLAALQRAVSLLETVQNLSIDKKNTQSVVTQLPPSLALPLLWSLPAYAQWYQRALTLDKPKSGGAVQNQAEKSANGSQKEVKKPNSPNATTGTKATSAKFKAPLTAKTATEKNSTVTLAATTSKLKAQPSKKMPTKTPVKALAPVKKVATLAKVGAAKPVAPTLATPAGSPPKSQPRSVAPVVAKLNGASKKASEALSQSTVAKEAQSPAFKPVVSVQSSSSPKKMTPISLPSSKKSVKKPAIVVKNAALQTQKQKINAEKSVEKSKISQTSAASMAEAAPKTSWIPVSKPSKPSKR